MPNKTSSVRDAIVGLGAKLPAGVRQKLSGLTHDVELTAWMRDHGMTTDTVVDTRVALYEIVAADIGDQPVCYLEFGVAAGDATRIWSTLLTHPDTVLHGFDTFEGLPEQWTEDEPRGKYTQGGTPPVIDDPRVEFFTGLFDQTLPAYQVPDRPHYVLNMDADLYSSTIDVLRHLGDLLRPGTYIYFDEFASPGHEERALREVVDETGVELDLVAATPGRWHMLFRVR